MKKADNLDWNKYDFIDLGCKYGNSISFCKKRLGAGHGLGIDVQHERVQETIKAGYDALLLDATSMEVPDGCVRFVSMMNFLEHLPNLGAVEEVLSNMKRAAREFLFIRHPSFEDMDYLRRFGLKISWTDWHGHPSPIKIEEFREMFHKLGMDSYEIIPGSVIKDSSDVHIVPLDAPIDTISYSAALGEKPRVVFDRPVYNYFDIFVKLIPSASIGNPHVQETERFGRLLSPLRRARFFLRGYFSGKPVLKYIVSIYDYIRHGKPIRR